MYISIDTETGGLDPTSNSLLTLGMVVFGEAGEVWAETSVALRPYDGIYRVTPGALRVNNINLIDHDKVAIDTASFKDNFKEFLESYSRGSKITIVGWNVSFDLGFIYNQVMSKQALEQYISYHYIDVAVLYHTLQRVNKIPKTKLSLVAAMEHFGIDTGAAHNALADASATYKVYLKCLELMK